MAEYLRESRYAYPLVNSAHILALATLFGSILALDLRVLGLFRRVPLGPLAEVLPRVSAVGLGIAAVTGFALLAVQPFDYLANPVFPVKLALIAIGALNALVLHRAAAWRGATRQGTISGHLRLAAAISVIAWTGAIVAGRWLAF